MYDSSRVSLEFRMFRLEQPYNDNNNNNLLVSSTKSLLSY